MARTRRESSLEPGFQAQVREVEGARAFVTIGPDDPRWTHGWDSSADLTTLGAFVRLEPPPDASDETVALMRREAERKALRVVVLPRRRASVVTAPKERKPHRRARDVVAELVRDANVPEEDRAALSELTEVIMAKARI